MDLKLCLILIFFNFNYVIVKGSSLVIVIDDTASMADDISEVKAGAGAIFQTYLEHRNESQIHNFILITFNDDSFNPGQPCSNPSVIVRANTTNRVEFQTAVNNTHVVRGDRNFDCAECAMAGIIKGLEGSHPKSTIYVFTDATAKDHFRFEEMKKIALNKQSQVVFVLTGACGEPVTSPRYKVYEDTATVTGGMVMHIRKGENNKILEYVKKTITGNRDTIHDKTLLSGFHNITFSADNLMGEILLIFTSKVPNKPSVNVNGPDGSPVPITTVIDLAQVAVYTFSATTPGIYSLAIDTAAPTHTVLSALSRVDFQYGFSTLDFSSILGTSIRPIPGAESYLLIKLNKGDIELKRIQIVDLAGHVLQTLPLQLTNQETNLYKTEAFVPPQTTFKIAVVGYHAESESYITRSTPPTAPQDPPLPDCVVDRSRLVDAKAPLILDSLLSWPELELPIEYENILWPKGRPVYWFCPSGFTISHLQIISTVCDGGANFMFKGKLYNYSDFKCNEEVIHTAKKTSLECYGPNTEMVKIGYNVIEDVNTEVYEICFDSIAKVPKYSKHILHISHASISVNEHWFDSKEFEMDFDKAYNCHTQKMTIQEQLGMNYHIEDEYCFKERQLVSSSDVFPGVPQRATFSYYNVLPQWSAYSENWDEIENRVRSLAVNSNISLLVWTGTAEVLHYGTKSISLSEENKNYKVPMYWWKVVQDLDANCTLAIIQVNDPDYDISDSFPCEDFCDETGWMENNDWHEKEMGYTYCCNITDFEKAFGFEGIFEPGMEDPLIRH